MGGQNGYPPLLAGGSPTFAVRGRGLPHGAKPPNGESLETQKPKCPLSDSRRSVGSPRGVHFSFCFPKLSPPPFLLLSSFSFFFLLPFLFFPPMHIVLAPSSAGPFGPCGQGGRRESATGGMCIRDLPRHFGVVSRALPPSPLGCSPERLPLRTVVLPRVTLGGGQGPRSSGRVWVCHLRQALGNVPWSLIHCTPHGGPQGCGCAVPMNAFAHIILI